MDVWYDSAMVASNMKHLFGYDVPADVVIEGKDQFRGWFGASLIITYLLYQQVPFRKVICHGFVIDKAKNKLSKSKRNYLPLDAFVNQYGADIFRL